jgi:HEAT repeat protein
MLGKVGPNAKAAAPLLLAAMQNDVDYVRCIAAVALTRIGVEKEAAVSTLVDMVTRLDRFDREDAARGLFEVVGQVDVPTNALRERLADRDEDVRLWAVRALGAMGPRAREGTLDLVTLAEKDGSDAVREAAITALEKVDPQREYRVWMLSELLRHASGSPKRP